ncbi:hypothetical protein ETB97_008481 [Aspergillus alliaceus]|uniref:Uncharacterized protein n=1 Tax=Petromyces alliaceus TaxID=209559 RepID=A0A8H6E2E6_PETAA|nr:hypothetical protein ETB97_008481 [Aspergillus burnettii]
MKAIIIFTLVNSILGAPTGITESHQLDDLVPSLGSVSSSGSDLGEFVSLVPRASTSPGVSRASSAGLNGGGGANVADDLTKLIGDGAKAFTNFIRSPEGANIASDLTRLLGNGAQTIMKLISSLAGSAGGLGGLGSLLGGAGGLLRRDIGIEELMQSPGIIERDQDASITAN